MDLTDTLTSLAKQTKSSTPPAQWVFLIILTGVSLVASWLVSREVATHKAQREHLEHLNARINEGLELARIEADVKKANELVAQAEKNKQILAEATKVWAEADVALAQRQKKILDAKNWQELTDA